MDWASLLASLGIGGAGKAGAPVGGQPGGGPGGQAFANAFNGSPQAQGGGILGGGMVGPLMAAANMMQASGNHYGPPTGLGQVMGQGLSGLVQGAGIDRDMQMSQQQMDTLRKIQGIIGSGTAPNGGAPGTATPGTGAPVPGVTQAPPTTPIPGNPSVGLMGSGGPGAQSFANAFNGGAPQGPMPGAMGGRMGGQQPYGIPSGAPAGPPQQAGLPGSPSMAGGMQAGGQPPISPMLAMLLRSRGGRFA